MDRLPQLDASKLARRNARLRRVCLTACAIIICVTLVVLVTWLSHAEVLARRYPFIFEMKINTVIGFALAAISLFALQQRRTRTSVALGLVLGAVGTATVVEYLGAPFAIDEILLRDWTDAAEVFPGRSALITAALFVVIGAAIVVLSRSRGAFARICATQLAPLIMFAVAFEAIAGHLTHSGFAMAWWASQEMSLPSAFCTLTLAAGLISYGWQFETTHIARLPVWVPILYGFSVALFDTSTPLEVNAGILYIPLVAFALWFERGYMALIFATVSSLLIVLGIFSSPPGNIPFEIVLLNRGLAIGSVWVTAALVYSQHVVRKHLRQSQQHFAAAQRIASVGSFELLFCTRALRASETFATMHGLDSGEDLSWDSLIAQSVAPDDHPALADMISDARAGARPRDIEYSFLRPDGAVRNGMMHCDLLFDSSGQPAGVIGVVHDVTDLRRAYAQQADLEGQLRHAQKLEALGTLAGSIAHDMNNTLVPITTLAPLLIGNAKPSDKHILEIMLNAARRAKELVREMLVFSRKDEAPPEPFHLDQLVEDALVIIRAGIPASIAIVKELTPVPAICGRKGQIYQAVLNMVTNAAQAIGDRSGTITIGVGLNEKQDGRPSDIRLFISDDGPGMSSEVAQRIFEPYFTTKSTTTGTGLGLAIVNGIVKSYGGHILVRSVVGEGTRFDMLFPSPPETPAPRGESA